MRLMLNNHMLYSVASVQGLTNYITTHYDLAVMPEKSPDFLPLDERIISRLRVMSKERGVCAIFTFSKDFIDVNTYGKGGKFKYELFTVDSVQSLLRQSNCVPKKSKS